MAFSLKMMVVVVVVIFFLPRAPGRLLNEPSVFHALFLTSPRYLLHCVRCYTETLELVFFNAELLLRDCSSTNLPT